MFRKPVNKSRSARKFRSDVGKTRRENLVIQRGGFRL